LVSFGVAGFVKSLREVPTILLMRLAFGAGLCRFGMFRAVRASGKGELAANSTGVLTQVGQS
jgi:MPBQ/MSBQ methyltransferase